MTKLISYNRKNRDYDAWLNEEYIGSFATYNEAEDELDRLASEQIRRAA